MVDILSPAAVGIVGNPSLPNVGKANVIIGGSMAAGSEGIVGIIFNPPSDGSGNNVGSIGASVGTVTVGASVGTVTVGASVGTVTVGAAVGALVG